MGALVAKNSVIYRGEGDRRRVGQDDAPRGCPDDASRVFVGGSAWGGTIAEDHESRRPLSHEVRTARELGPEQEGEHRDEDAPDRFAAGKGARASRTGRGRKARVSRDIKEQNEPFVSYQ